MNAAAPASAPQSTGVVDVVRQRLQANSITRAAIVDDTFDGITEASFEDQDLPAFEDALVDNAVMAEFKRLVPEYDEDEGFDLDAARKLWELRAQWAGALVGPAKRLFNRFQTQNDRLARISTALNKVGLEVVEFGIPRDVKVLHGFPLVFLDYQLESEAELKIAKEKALAANMPEAGPKKSQEIALQLAKSDTRPFLVLISSIALGEIQNDFRERANYVRGTFGVLSKNDAGNEQILFVNLYAWGVGHPALRAISDFISAFGQRSAVVSADFTRSILQLDVQDYSFIQRLSLSGDGEPLGEYFLQLLTESLSHRIRNDKAVITTRKTLDTLHFKEHLSSAVQPSDTVSRLYSEALTDRGPEPLENHPLQHLDDLPSDKALPRVMQGDLFYNKRSKKVYVIMNCGCDLQFSPVNRPPDPETTLLLVEGDALPYSQRPPKIDLRTEPFLIDETPHRICWYPKRVKPMMHKDLRKWCNDSGFVRIGRLRDLQAASIQQAWAAKNARVGLPVTPPFFSAADFELYVVTRGETGKDAFTRVSHGVGDVILSQHWSTTTELADRFIFTPSGVEKLSAGLPKAVELLSAEVEKASSNKKPGAQSNRSSVEALANNFSSFYFLLAREHELPVTGKNTVLTEVSIPVFNSADFSAPDMKSPNKAFLILNIIPQPPEEVPAVESAPAVENHEATPVAASANGATVAGTASVPGTTFQSSAPPPKEPAAPNDTTGAANGSTLPGE
jgi:hypothetical protein